MRYVWRVQIDDDPYYANPRDADNLSELALYANRYDLPNDSHLPLATYESFDELIEAVRGIGGVHIIPVWMYSHSGVLIRAGESNPFADPWDSGLIGVAYTTAERIALMGTTEDLIDECIRAEVDEYGMWMAGEVYTVVVFDTYNRVEVENISGVIGLENAEAEAASMAAAWNKDPSTEGVA